MLPVAEVCPVVTVYLESPQNGVESHIRVENKRTGLQTTIEVISRIDLSPAEMRQALTQALGNRWDYKFLGIVSYPYHF